MGKFAVRQTYENEYRRTAGLIGALVVWAISGLAIGSAFHPIPLASALLALGMQIRNTLRDKGRLPWTLALAAALAAAFWISPLPTDPAAPPPEPEKVDYVGFAARLEQVDPTGLTATLVLEDPEMELFADGTLKLTRYEKNGWFEKGKWVEAQKLYSGAKGSWKEQEVTLPADGSPVTVEYDWTYAYLELTPGWYRAYIQVKEFMGQYKETKSWRVFGIPVQFEIK
jgi:hypothetical protein